MVFCKYSKVALYLAKAVPDDGVEEDRDPDMWKLDCNLSRDKDLREPWKFTCGGLERNMKKK